MLEILQIRKLKKGRGVNCWRQKGKKEQYELATLVDSQKIKG